MSLKFRKPFKRKKMSDPKEIIEEHHENEEVKPISEPRGPEIEPLPEQASAESDAEKVKAELAETRDKFVRLFAEFENFRKRTQNERIELFKSANASLMLDLLPVLDDAERALKFEPGSEPKEGGMQLILQKLKSILESRGLKRMTTIGEPFNVDHHEAIAQVPAPSQEMKGKVLEEAVGGYFLNDKVIRHAKVIVGS